MHTCTCMYTSTRIDTHRHTHTRAHAHTHKHTYTDTDTDTADTHVSRKFLQFFILGNPVNKVRLLFPIWCQNTVQHHLLQCLKEIAYITKTFILEQISMKMKLTILICISIIYLLHHKYVQSSLCKCSTYTYMYATVCTHGCMYIYCM